MKEPNFSDLWQEIDVPDLVTGEGDNVDDKAFYGFGPENFERALSRARDLNLEVVVGLPDTLLIDLDEGMVLNDGLLQTISEHLGSPIMDEWISKSGNKHVTLQFFNHAFNVLEALLLEVALGSDPWRGFLSMMDMRHGVLNPRTLFRPKVTHA